MSILKKLALVPLAVGVLLTQASLAWAGPVSQPALDAAGAGQVVSRVDPQVRPAVSRDKAIVSQGSVQSGRVKVGIPRQGQVSSVSGGTVVRPSSGQVSFVVRDVDEGTQIASVSTSAEGLNDLRYTFTDSVLEAHSSGAVIVRDARSGEPLGVVEAPWAKDSTGADLPTRYRIEGSTLIQTVSVNEKTKYPVVADPRIRSAWYGISVDFTYGETSSIAAGSGGCVAISGLVPGAAGAIMRLACGTFGVVAGNALANNKCLSVKFFISLGFGTPWISPCYAW